MDLESGSSSCRLTPPIRRATEYRIITRNARELQSENPKGFTLILANHYHERGWRYWPVCIHVWFPSVGVHNVSPFFTRQASEWRVQGILFCRPPLNWSVYYNEYLPVQMNSSSSFSAHLSIFPGREPVLTSPCACATGPYTLRHLRI